MKSVALATTGVYIEDIASWADFITVASTKLGFPIVRREAWINGWANTTTTALIPYLRQVAKACLRAEALASFTLPGLRRNASINSKTLT